MNAMRLFSTVILSDDGGLATTLEATPGVDFRRHVSASTELTEAVHEIEPDLLFLDLGAEADAVLSAVEKLEAPAPVFVFCGPDDSRLIRRAMRAGGREYIETGGGDEGEQARAALARLTAELPARAPERRAALVAVMGTKGGTGATFVACQLAASLARGDDQVALVDGHLRMGDVALQLDLEPDYSLANLADQTDLVDSTYLRTILTTHGSGVSVLAAPHQPEEADVLSVAAVGRASELLASEFDWIVWDVPRDFDDRSVLVLDRADLVLLVTTPDVPALHHTKLNLDLLTRLGRSPETTRTVINREDKRAPVSPKEARAYLEREVDAALPNAYDPATTCVNEGRTMHDVAPRSTLSAAIGDLASKVRVWCGRAEPPARSGGLLSRLRRR